MWIPNLGSVRPPHTKTSGDFVEILKHIGMKNRFLACLAISVSFYKSAWISWWNISSNPKLMLFHFRWFLWTEFWIISLAFARHFLECLDASSLTLSLFILFSSFFLAFSFDPIFHSVLFISFSPSTYTFNYVYFVLLFSLRIPFHDFSSTCLFLPPCVLPPF